MGVLFSFILRSLIKVVSSHGSFKSLSFSYSKTWNQTYSLDLSFSITQIMQLEFSQETQGNHLIHDLTFPCYASKLINPISISIQHCK